MSVALFDLDGTLTRRDTLFDFLRFYSGNLTFCSKLILIAPVLAVNYFLKHEEQIAKENLLSFFLKNKPRKFLEEIAMRYADRLDDLVKPNVWKRLQELKTCGVRVAIVSASLDLWLDPWCRRHGLDLISSRALWIHNRFSGRLDGPNCRGEEKVRRIQEYFGENIVVVEAWGDSPADFPMLRLAQRAYYRGKPWNPPPPAENNEG
jgi:HAD superfamily hydrolase (TIGR01490 family)